MDSVKTLSIWIFIVPIVVLNSCLFISVNWELFQDTIFQVNVIGRSGFTIPYIDGGTSISRSSRTYPAYLLFKPGMIITSILLIKYWVENNKLFNKIDEHTNLNFFVMVLFILLLQYLCNGHKLNAVILEPKLSHFCNVVYNFIR